MAPQAILVSDWSISIKPSPLKPLGQITKTWLEASMAGQGQEIKISKDYLKVNLFVWLVTLIYMLKYLYEFG
jgi:hypothetical protein